MIAAHTPAWWRTTRPLAAWLWRVERREAQGAALALASSPQISSSRSTRPQADL